MDFNELKRIMSDELEKADKDKTFSSYPKRPVDRPPSFKETNFAELAKAEGNKLYGSLTSQESPLHYKVLHLYNKSIAFSISESEGLAAAYSNKSVLLKRMRRYSECIAEIDKGFKISQSISLKIKLLCRKAECLTALGSSDNRRYLEKARFFMSRLEGDENKMEKMLRSLIKKTQKIVDEAKLDQPKTNRRKTEATQEVAEVEKQSIWDSVGVEYSIKYGRHLVAKRDFEPGDILYVERPYRSNLHDHKVHLYCCHCFEYLWTIVPGNHCPWRAFCSEKCKVDACSEYHGLECSILCHMRETLPLHPSNYLVPFLITVFCKALTEAGSIGQMQAELESIDQCTDPCNAGFSSDGEFSSYKSLYSLPIRGFPERYYQSSIKGVALAVTGISKYTELFGKTYDFCETRKLRQNSSALFVAAFLLKVSLVTYGQCITSQLYDPSEEEEAFELSGIDYQAPPCANSLTDTTLVLTSALTIVSCIPNVEKTITFGTKFVTYALQPIKAGTKISHAKILSCIYDMAPESIRQSIHQELYNCPCECKACVNGWSETVGDFSSLQFVKVPADLSLHQHDFAISFEIQSIHREWEKNAHKQNYPSMRQILELKHAIAEAWKYMTMPSIFIVQAIGVMRMMFLAFYNPSEKCIKDTGLQLKEASSSIHDTLGKKKSVLSGIDSGRFLP